MHPALQELLELNDEAIDLDAHILRGFLVGDVASRIDAWVKREDEKYGLKHGVRQADGGTGNGRGEPRGEHAEGESGTTPQTP